MLSIVPLKDANAAKSYYELDNYYAKGSEEAIEASHWYGKGAAILGLSGYVELTDFEKLLTGELPNGVQLGRKAGDDVKHRPGYDLTFSAPKSVSILCEVGGDVQLRRAHDQAVKDALEYVERSALQTRAFRNKEIVFEDVNNMTAALFRHDTSRELDPQTHTHCVVLNAVLRQDGVWRSISSESLFDHKMVAGMVYRSSLALGAKKLGYDIDITHSDGRFEIAGVPEALIQHFSKRRQEIEKTLNEKGWEGAKASEAVTLNTRKKKMDIDREDLKKGWQEGCKFFDLDMEILKVQAKARSHEVSHEHHRIAEPDHAISFAIDHLGEMESVFSQRQLLREALAASLGECSVSGLEKAIQDKVKDGQLIDLNEGMWSTPQAKRLEETIIHTMVMEKDKLQPITSPDVVSTYVQQSEVAYRQGQIEAANLVLTTKDRFVGIQGDAGTGKTTVLKAVKAMAEAEGYRVLGISPTKSAALEMTEKAGIHSATVQKFIIDNVSPYIDVTQSSKSTLLIVDESSMLGIKQARQLMDIATRDNLRVAFVGDTKQLSAVQAGKPFAITQRAGMATAQMREVVRQREGSAMRKAVDSITHDHNIKESIRYLCVKEEGNKDHRLQKVANAYLEQSKTLRDRTLVLVPANDDRLAINHLIRQGLKEQGSLTGQEAGCQVLLGKNLSQAKSYKATSYEAGDVLFFHQAIKRQGIGHAGYYQIESIDRITNTLILRSHQQTLVNFNLSKAKLNNYNLNSYRQEERGLMAGDTIRWLKNSTDGRRVNGHTAAVESVTGHTAQIKTYKGEIMTINLNQLEQSHWDYAFAHTIHAAQGKDKPHVIAHLESFRPNLIHQSAFYTVVSRAESSVTLFVDDKELCINTIEKNTGQKLSVLESLGELPDWKDLIQHTEADKDKIQDQFKEPTIKKPYWNLGLIQLGLVNQAVNLAERLLGQPNHKLSTPKQLRYGKKGSLLITTQGSRAGTWKNFETGEGGNLIKLIEAQGYSFKEALAYAGSFLNISPEMKVIPPETIKSPKKSAPVVNIEAMVRESDDKDREAMQRVQKIVSQCQPITDTLAKRYLKERRGITADPGKDFMFHPALYDSQTKTKYPALVAVARNTAGEVQGAQAIYLDPKTLNKADIPIKKRTFGRISLGARIHMGNPESSHLYIAEGPETALSILSAKPDARVMACLSASNFLSHDLDKSIKSVTICADNDGPNAGTTKSVEKAAWAYITKGIKVNVIKPEQEKSDFNDLLLSSGVEAVRERIDPPEKEVPSKELECNLVEQERVSNNLPFKGKDHLDVEIEI